MHPSEAGKNEVKNINGAYAIIERLLERAKVGNIDGIKANIEDLKATRKFVESNLPHLDTSENKGVYSIAHMMDNMLFFLEQIITDNDPQVLGKAAGAAEQLKRLMTNGTRLDLYKSRRKSNEPNDRTGTAGRNELPESAAHAIVPNLVEIPTKWKISPEGKKFDDHLNTFLQSSKPVTDTDLTLLKEMADLISHCYDGKTVSKDELNKVAYARELIMINLAILLKEANRAKGQLMPKTTITVSAVKNIIGLRNLDSLQFGKFHITNQSSDDTRSVMEREPGILPQPKFEDLPDQLIKS